MVSAPAVPAKTQTDTTGGTMKRQILISILMKMFDSVLKTLEDTESLKGFADFLLDQVENYAMSSKTKLDDATVLPICTLTRKIFNIQEFE
jgi:hypothetical protein